MHEAPAETLFLEDRTGWTPRARGGADRRGLVAALAALGAFAALLALTPAPAPPAPPPARRYLVGRVSAPVRAPTETPRTASRDCSPPPAE
ncbi:MAG: hypothetical protein R3A48_27230 [Polyangiales bacterium]